MEGTVEPTRWRDPPARPLYATTSREGQSSAPGTTGLGEGWEKGIHRAPFSRSGNLWGVRRTPIDSSSANRPPQPRMRGSVVKRSRRKRFRHRKLPMLATANRFHRGGATPDSALWRHKCWDFPEGLFGCRRPGFMASQRRSGIPGRGREPTRRLPGTETVPAAPSGRE